MFTESPLSQEHRTKERIDRYQREASTYRALKEAGSPPSEPRMRRETLWIRALRLLLG